MDSREQELKGLEVLVVEDNPVDVLMIKDAFDEAALGGTLHVVEDGEAALEFLRERCKTSHAKMTCPNLILLDLNLPRRSGKEVLAQIKNDPHLLCIPVIVLTTSSDEKDVCETYSLHANCFITKPVELEQFTEVVRSIQRFWLATARLPAA